MAYRDVGANMFSKLMKDFLRGPETKPAGTGATDFGATAFLTAAWTRCGALHAAAGGS